MQVDFTFKEKVMVEEDINEAIKEFAIAVGNSNAELEACARSLGEAFGKVKITKYEGDALISLTTSDDIHLPLEPLWVRNQQQKIFKRGKK